jgi:hypothetical protein
MIYSRIPVGDSVVYDPNHHPPPSEDNLRQINMTISWFLWKGEIFRIPLSTLQRTKEGGWGLINPAAKCMALFISRMREQSMRKGTVTADWIEKWGLQKQTKIPSICQKDRDKAGLSTWI